MASSPVMLVRFVQRQLARFWPLKVIGDDNVGYSAKFPWDKNWCWASKRKTVEVGARQRGREDPVQGTKRSMRAKR